MSPPRIPWAWLGLGGVAVVAAIGGRAVAMPPAPAAFCEVYPTAPACAAGDAACTTCHVSAPALNVYGADVSANLVGERPLHEDVFLAGLGDALRAVEGLDSDGDGVANLDEILAGSAPSDAESLPAACEDHNPRDGWTVCGYDANLAYKKVMIDFCGRSPSLAEREAFADEKDAHAALHDALDACLDTEAWRGIGGRVWNLANKKIGPLAAIKAGKDAGPIPLADYDDDYAYFVWTQTDGHDVREVITGNYFATARVVGGQTVIETWDRTPEEDLAVRGYDRYQAVEKNRRAGLLTHRWFLMSNTMFTPVPRTTAAQAYRAFLGLDISHLEGLQDVPGEPVDYDHKGVAAPACAACHKTLDPATYPFSRYEGIGGGRGDSYSYSPNRLEGFVDEVGPDITEVPENGVVLGQPVADLVEWAEVAAGSVEFRRAVVRDYWRMLLGEEPRAADQAEFGALVDGLATTWSVEAMLHDLVDTEAYGAP